MIRTSGIVAVLAIVLSLILHGLGLSLTMRDAPPSSSDGTDTDVADTGGAFEDFVEPAQAAEPPEVTPSDPVDVTEATSNAQVASDNPQDTLTPDAAAASDVVADAEDLSEGVPDAAEEQEQSGDDAENIGELAALQPDDVPSDEATPEAVPEVAEPETTAAVTPDVVTPEAAELLPSEPAEASPDVEVVDTDSPDIVVTARPDAPDEAASDQSEDLSLAAVTRSLRPPTERPSTEALGATEYVEQQRQARVIESPLDVYRRTGVDQITLGSRRGTSGATSFVGSGGAGNASTTNYVGRVLVQLNRFPVGNVSDSGTARVQFQINPNGTLAWVRIVRSSGSASVDRAATTQVRRAAPFPRTPDGTSRRLVFLYRNK